VPTYDYRCETCENIFEVFQSFSEDPLTTCPPEKCEGSGQGSVKKIFSAPGIAFKGSGFYKNDSRSKGSSSKTGASQKSTSTETSADKNPVSDKPKKAESATPSSSSKKD
tara:strand:- start:72 stop:401 length:330 start_codon:yes stop_codon:yes gene_type:complete